MNNLEFTRMEAIVSMQVLNETQRLAERKNAGEEIVADEVMPITLDNLRESFDAYGPEFMSDELLQKNLSLLKKRYSSLKEDYPQGSDILLGAFPCDKNGGLYTPEEIKKGQYLTLLYIDKKTGLSVGFGGVGLNTYAKLLPKEIQEQCTFTVKYESDAPWADMTDFEKFAQQYTAAYKALQKLLCH